MNIDALIIFLLRFQDIQIYIQIQPSISQTYLKFYSEIVFQQLFKTIFLLTHARNQNHIVY